MIKTKETSKGKTKIIISGKQAESLYKLLDTMTVFDIVKYTNGPESNDVRCIWYALEKVHNPQCV